MTEKAATKRRLSMSGRGLPGVTPKPEQAEQTPGDLLEEISERKETLEMESAATKTQLASLVQWRSRRGTTIASNGSGV